MASARRRASEYPTRVFINCPFDAEYRSLFEAIVFAVSDCGYVPRKSCLVLDREQYRYQKFCSDIAGQDISAHGQEPEQAVRHVRHWLSTADRETLIPGPRRIWGRYEQFRLELPRLCEIFQQDIEDLTFTNYSVLVERWLELNPW